MHFIKNLFNENKKKILYDKLMIFCDTFIKDLSQQISVKGALQKR